MNTFLKYVADDIYDKLNGNFQDTTIVFPNKRATLFFNQYLWEKSGGKTMWTPEYIAISDLFTSLSKCTIADPIYLICNLYQVYLKHNPNTEKTFDELYPFLEMMLADFQDVDSNLVPAEKIFRNISELQQLTDYDFLEEKQIEAISRFFNDLRWEDKTKTQQNFASIWNNLLDIYTDFKELLFSYDDSLLYEGLLKRTVVEPAISKDEDAAKATDVLCSRLTSANYVFVGFNVLNKAEKELFKLIKKNRNAYFYWDYDISYCSGNPMSSKANKHGFEAGMFIMENIRDLGSAFSSSSEIYQNMKKPKQISFIKSPTENAQSRYISQWVDENINYGDTLNDSAIVLCNENLLQPVLHSIPPCIADPSDESKTQNVVLNVTMGYPLSETPIYSLIQALLELQLRGRTPSGAWRHKHVSAILKHPYIRRITKGNASKTLIQLTSNNIVFPTDDAFKDDEFLSLIFTKKNGKDLTLYLAEILSNAADGIQYSKEHEDFDTQLYKESTFAAYTAVNRMHNLQEKMPTVAQLHDSTISRLICQMLQRITIPFHGEPANGLQIMGFLETRNLDFRNVILLSAGEGQMPKANKRPSLIPYTLQVAFGMTTIDKEVSIYAYYFYRLLQRAENITVLWNSSTEEGHKGEMSRFLLQLLVEADNIFVEGQKINLHTFITPSESMPAIHLGVEKAEEIMRRLHKRFDIATEQSAEWKEKNKNRQLLLSPSAILCHMKCPMQFFFKYVAALRPDDEISDDVDDAIFGDIFHYAMEHVYKPYVGLHLTSDQIQNMANDDERIRFLVNAGFQVKLFKMSVKNDEDKLNVRQINYSGDQLIKHYVLCKLIKIQLEADAETARNAEKTGGSFTILALEEQHSTIQSIQPDESQPAFNVRLGGYIDRIDMIDDGNTKTIRIVDYKTASSHHEATNVQQLFDSSKVNTTYHITQTLYYCEVLTQEGKHNADKLPVVPALMYYKNTIKKENPVIKLNCENLPKEGRKKPTIVDYVENCRDEFKPLMMNAINSIFQPGSFTQCEDDHTCKYCDFKLLCNRNPKDKY